MRFGASNAKIIAFEISSASRPSISLCLSTNASRDFSVIVFVSSVRTTPGSILVTRIFFRTESSCLNPSVNAATANFVAQYDAIPGTPKLAPTDATLTIPPILHGGLVIVVFKSFSFICTPVDTKSAIFFFSLEIFYIDVLGQSPSHQSLFIGITKIISILS